MTPLPRTAAPEISFVIPAYNEEGVLAATLRQMLAAFDEAGIPLELVVVDNGSSDRTGEIAREFAERTGAARCVRVERNIGYGNGVLQGIPACTAPWIGIIPADGQVDADDVVRLFESVRAADRMVLAKARRRFRLDGFRRKAVSVAYNLLVLAFWPRIGSLDINGSPKILHRDVLRAMDLTSCDWFLDPEIMIKAHHLGVRVQEFNVFSRLRGSGLSHVRATTCWEFLRNLLAYRFSGRLAAWRRAVPRVPPPEPPSVTGAAPAAAALGAATR